MPKTWNTVLLAYPASCLALMNGLKQKLHARCHHWSATSAVLTTWWASWYRIVEVDMSACGLLATPRRERKANEMEFSFFSTGSVAQAGFEKMKSTCKLRSIRNLQQESITWIQTNLKQVWGVSGINRYGDIGVGSASCFRFGDFYVPFENTSDPCRHKRLSCKKLHTEQMLVCVCMQFRHHADAVKRFKPYKDHAIYAAQMVWRCCAIAQLGGDAGHVQLILFTETLLAFAVRILEINWKEKLTLLI